MEPTAVNTRLAVQAARGAGIPPVRPADTAMAVTTQ
jgi:hypothetical protein